MLNNKLKKIKNFTINFGPQHSAAQDVLRLLLKFSIINFFTIILLFFFMYNFNFFVDLINIFCIIFNHKKLDFTEFDSQINISTKNNLNKKNIENKFYIMFTGAESTELFSINKTIFESFVKLELVVSPFKNLLNILNKDFFLIKKGSIIFPNYEFNMGEEEELLYNIKFIFYNSKICLDKLKFKYNISTFIKNNYIVIVDSKFFYILKAFVKVIEITPESFNYRYITINNKTKIRTHRFFYNFLKNSLFKIKSFKMHNLYKKLKMAKKNKLLSNKTLKPGTTKGYYGVNSLYVAGEAFLAIKKTWSFDTIEQQIYVLYKNFVNSGGVKNTIVGLNPIKVDFLPLFQNWLYLDDDNYYFGFEKIEKFISFILVECVILEKKIRITLSNLMDKLRYEIKFNAKFKDVSLKPNYYAKRYKENYFNKIELGNNKKSKFLYIFFNNYNSNNLDRDLDLEFEYAVWLFISLNLIEPFVYLDPTRKTFKLLIEEILNFYFNNKFFESVYDNTDHSFIFTKCEKYYPSNKFFKNFLKNNYEQNSYFDQLIISYKCKILNVKYLPESFKKIVEDWEFNPSNFIMLNNYIIFKFMLFFLVINSFFIVFSKNAIFALFFLVLSFIYSFVIILSIECDFIGIFFVIIYIGAISVLFLFLIMMIDIKLKNINKNMIIYTTVGLFFFFIIFLLIVKKINFNKLNIYYIFNNNFYNWIDLTTNLHDIEIYSLILYDYFVIHLLIIGLILLAILIGVVHFTKIPNNSKKQFLYYKQLSKNKNF